MPRIENFDPAAVRTPLQPLFPELITSFLRLSPNSRETAEKIVKARGIRFELDASTNECLLQASAFHDGTVAFHQRFCVGLKVLERMWASVFGYYVLFKWTSDRFNTNLRKENPPPAPLALPYAIELLTWAFSYKHGSEMLLWPPHLPSPSCPLADDKLMRAVNAASVRTAGFILLHELGHFDRGHLDSIGGSANPHDSEHEADDWASETATDSIANQHCQANLCTIPFALGFVAGISRRESPSHPATADRLARFYRKHICPKTKGNGSLFNTALFATTTPLQALLFLNGIQPERLKMFPDLEEFLDWWQAEMDRLAPSS